MLTKDQLESVRHAMEEEHRLDREALRRLSRFLEPKAEEISFEVPSAESESVNYSYMRESSLLGQIESLLRVNSDKTWTVQSIKRVLLQMGCLPKAKKPEATISVALRKLSDRGKLTLVSKGSGREPNVYQWHNLFEWEEPFRVDASGRPLLPTGIFDEEN